jgi:hypothetical protein
MNSSCLDNWAKRVLMVNSVPLLEPLGNQLGIVPINNIILFPFYLVNSFTLYDIHS